MAKWFTIVLTLMAFSLLSASRAEAQNSNPSGSLPSAWPQVSDVEAQPLIASVKRLVTALALAGSPLNEATLQQLEQAYAAGDADRSNVFSKCSIRSAWLLSRSIPRAA